MLPFIRKRKIFYVISIILIVLSVGSILKFGLNPGIDFTGGSLAEVSYKTQTPSVENIRESLEELKLEEFSVQKEGDSRILVRTTPIDEATHQKILDKLGGLAELQEDASSFKSIGPVIGEEVKDKTRSILIITLIGILIYIAFSFRRISRPVKSYVYGFTSLIALFHDVLIPLGVLSALGHFYGVEFTVPIATAFLTVFGYSINDSVVVFDRVRENLLKLKEPNFGVLVEKSLNEVISRSISTSLTTLFVLLAIFFFGGFSLRYFSLVLILGIVLGTYSSLFLATPLIVSYKKKKEAKYKQ